jgi:hypothetical protein
MIVYCIIRYSQKRKVELLVKTIDYLDTLGDLVYSRSKIIIKTHDSE